MLLLTGSPSSAGNQLIASLNSQPGFEGLFPEPDEAPAPSPAESDQQHLRAHPGVVEVQQPETVAHSPPLEARIRQGPGKP